MCAIIGALIYGNENAARHIIASIWARSHERGRDGRGYWLQAAQPSGKLESLPFRDISRADNAEIRFSNAAMPLRTFIANLRAEPTTEYVANKKIFDQQPYHDGMWSIVHNGTIANDKELRSYKLPTRIDSAAIAEELARQDRDYPYLVETSRFYAFVNTVLELKGSYAILASVDGVGDRIFAACNYRPLWYVEVPGTGVFFASSRNYLPAQYATRMLAPYTAAEFTIANGTVALATVELRKPSGKSQRRALVVCSGGLDSVVAATYAQRELDMDVTLLHFHYGSRAQGPEDKAIDAIADELGVSLLRQDISLYRKEDSPLLQADSKIAGGEAGAEFAHEWVPARNLLMLSMATAIAEARGIETIVLGNNLEEAGAYPDNEPEFIARFNDLLPFAVGDGKRMQVLMPVGNMMKHEIVALGVRIGAPLHLTWSCYRAGRLHCGTCGPCFMRRTAFKINNLEEVIEYEVPVDKAVRP